MAQVAPHPEPTPAGPGRLAGVFPRGEGTWRGTGGQEEGGGRGWSLPGCVEALSSSEGLRNTPALRKRSSRVSAGDLGGADVIGKEPGHEERRWSHGAKRSTEAKGALRCQVQSWDASITHTHTDPNVMCTMYTSLCVSV